MARARSSSLAISVILTLVSIAGCSPEPDILRAPVAIGVTTDSPAINYQDPVTGKRSGFEVSLYEWIATFSDEPFVPQVNEVVVSDREKVLVRGGDAGGVDLVVATYTITSVREEVIDFAGPYLETRQGVMLRADDPRRITNPSQLSGRSVCAEDGSTSLNELMHMRVSVSPKPTLVECVQDLRNRVVDVVSTDWMVLHGYARTDPELRVEKDVSFGAVQSWGIGLPPDDGTASCELVTGHLEKFMGSGDWETAFRNHFGDELDPADFKPENLNPCLADPDPEADKMRLASGTAGGS